jgi:hypothetical protein
MPPMLEPTGSALVHSEHELSLVVSSDLAGIVWGTRQECTAGIVIRT